MNLPDFFYYGSLGDGHHFHDPETGYMSRQSAVAKAIPWGYSVDQDLCPRRSDKGSRVYQGDALLHHKAEWTALAFRDRSGDSRPGSCSVFLAQGTWTFDEMVAQAELRFPELWKRLAEHRIEIRLVAERHEKARTDIEFSGGRGD